MAAALDWLIQMVTHSLAGMDCLDLAHSLRALAAWLDSEPKTNAALPPKLYACRDAAEGDGQPTVTPEVSVVIEVALRIERRMLQCQHEDGGWGRSGSCGSNSTTTGVCLEAALVWGKAARRRATDPEIQTALENAATFLLSQQQRDGRWLASAGSTETATTASALRALVISSQDANHPAALAGLNWLVAEQLDTGAWGSVTEDEQATAEALLALVETSFATKGFGLDAADWLTYAVDDHRLTTASNQGLSHLVWALSRWSAQTPATPRDRDPVKLSVFAPEESTPGTAACSLA